jgi:hypothetical protein
LTREARGGWKETEMERERENFGNSLDKQQQDKGNKGNKVNKKNK